MENTKKIKIISVIIICLASVLLLTVIFQFLRLNNLKNKELELTNSLSSLEEVIADYSQKKDYYQDREKYLDEYAHEVLNMSKEDETWYVANKN